MYLQVCSHTAWTDAEDSLRALLEAEAWQFLVIRVRCGSQEGRATGEDRVSEYLQGQPRRFQLFLQLAAQAPLVMPQGVIQVDSACAVGAHIIHFLLQSASLLHPWPSEGLKLILCPLSRSITGGARQQAQLWRPELPA